MKATVQLCLGLTLIAGCQRDSRNSQRPPDEPSTAPVVSSIDSTVTTASIDSLRVSLCQNINNSYECAQAIERHVLASGVPGVVRRGSELVIALATGDSLSLHDSTSGDDVNGVWHSYREYLSSIVYHVIELQYYEGGGYLFINGRSGKATRSNGLPIVSPDHRRVAAANVDFGSRYDPTTLQIWRVETDSLVLEWEKDLLPTRAVGDSIWAAGDPTWLSPTNLRVRKEHESGAVGGYAVLRLGPGGWTFTEP